MKRVKTELFNNKLVKYYEINIKDVAIFSKKSYKLSDNSGNEFFLKFTNLNSLEKYQFLKNQDVSDVLYPLRNKRNEFVTRNNVDAFYVNNFFNEYTILKEVKMKNLIELLDSVHTKTSFNRQLDPKKSRPRFDEIINRLDFKFRLFENYIRSVEAKPLNIFSMPVLSNYQYILDAKKELIRLQKRIISSVKAKESIEFSFIHNNPKLDHVLNLGGTRFLTSLDSGKIGIKSVDFAKAYLENETIDVDFKSIVVSHFEGVNPFYYDYFRYLVLVILIFSLNIKSDQFINASSFTSISDSIKRYFQNFPDFKLNCN